MSLLRRSLVIWLACAAVSSSLSGAVAEATTWEIRTAGNANNGGGFVTGASGTDRSQSDTAFCSASDLTLPTTTTATSAACPFSAASVGNIIHITAGANCTVGFYQVVSVAVATATLDRVAGTAVSCSAGVFALGGAVALPSTAFAAAVSGNTFYVKADGTYSVTTAATLNNTSSSSKGTKVIGYSATRGDNGVVTWNTSTNSINLVFGDTTYGASFSNFSFKTTAGTPGRGFSFDFAAEGIVVDNCVFDGFLNAMFFNRGGVNATFSRSEVKNSTAAGVQFGNGNSTMQVTVTDSYFHNNAGHGISFAASNGGVTVINTVSSKNTLDGLNVAAQTGETANLAIYLVGSVFSENSSDGFQYNGSGGVEATIVTLNSIYYGNTAFGINSDVVPSYQQSLNSAFGANGTARSNFTAGAADVTLTADPFVSKSTGNYALNATAGGGAALKGVGFPGIALFGTGAIDIGALQSAGGGGSSTTYVLGTTQ